MTRDNENCLPTCGIPKEDPARPPLSRRIKHWGMKAAGQVAQRVDAAAAVEHDAHRGVGAAAVEQVGGREQAPRILGTEGGFDVEP